MPQNIPCQSIPCMNGQLSSHNQAKNVGMLWYTKVTAMCNKAGFCGQPNHPLAVPAISHSSVLPQERAHQKPFPHNNVATSHVSVGRNLLKFVPTIFTLFLAFRPTHQNSWSLNNSQINELSIVNRAPACYHTPLIFAINVGIQHLPNIT